MTDKRPIKLDKTGITFALAGRKGGISKTSNTLGIGYALSRLGYKCLLVDCDPQSSLSQTVGVNPNATMDIPSLAIGKLAKRSKKARKDISNDYWIDDLNGAPTDEEQLESDVHGLHDLLAKAYNRDIISEEDINSAITTPVFTVSENNKNGEIIQKTYKYGFDIIASSDDLTDDELVFSLDQDPHKKAIKGLLLTIVLNEVRRYHPEYDFIICDTGPSLGIFTVNAIAAAKDGVIVSSNVDDQALWSLQRFKFNVRQIKHVFKDHLGILGVVIGNCDERSQMFPIIADKIQNTLHLYRFKTTITRSANAQKATAAQLLLPQIDERALQEYTDLSLEIINSYLSSKKHNQEWNKKLEKEIKKRRKENPESLIGMNDDEINEYLKSNIEQDYTDGNLWKFPMASDQDQKTQEDE